tara:strand:- start:251 stop:478 length:228 start_codon:yes stop_codon:yes gene_type:complete
MPPCPVERMNASLLYPHGKKRLTVPSLMRVVDGVIAIVIGVVVVDAAVASSYLYSSSGRRRRRHRTYIVYVVPAV